MAGQKEKNMDEQEEPKVSREMYINDATINYVRSRIEADVKRSFLQWIGMPIGGAGVIAILLSVLVWIPNKVTPIFDNYSLVPLTVP